MRKDDAIRLRHMLEAAREAISTISGLNRPSLNTDRIRSLALVRLVEIIGEAASKVSLECRTEYPQIPWANIIAMRNRLIHAYFDIDLDILWKTIIEDLPPLAQKIEEILQPSA